MKLLVEKRIFDSSCIIFIRYQNAEMHFLKYIFGKDVQFIKAAGDLTAK